MESSSSSDLGCVVIGRNEGARLDAALTSVLATTEQVVYVDSGSTDDSVSRAEGLNVRVVRLSDDAPFTAARARNAGLSALLETSGPAFVQFVDGDCEVAPNWLADARARFDARAEVAAVCGRIRERQRDRTIFNRLADIDWASHAVGDVDASGGNVMVRVAAFQSTGGFDPALIAGEEFELCLRLRQQGHVIECLEQDMVMHDMAMDHLGQWWVRSVRTGHAFAQGAVLHGDGADQYHVKARRRALIWGGAIPALAVSASLATHGASWLLLLAYPLAALRRYRNLRREGLSRDDAALYAAFLTLSHFPQMQGIVRFHLERMTGKRATLIEHKGPDKSASA
jgi:GT2 family glycosyltransferase